MLYLHLNKLKDGVWNPATSVWECLLSPDAMPSKQIYAPDKSACHNLMAPSHAASSHWSGRYQLMEVSSSLTINMLSRGAPHPAGIIYGCGWLQGLITILEWHAASLRSGARDYRGSTAGCSFTTSCQVWKPSGFHYGLQLSPRRS